MKETEAGTRESYWLETAPPGEPAPPPSGDLSVEVAVIGGRIAGLSTAWKLVRQGREVAVLEADRPAAGVTGHTTAKLTALHTLIYDHLHRARGPEGPSPLRISQRHSRTNDRLIQTRWPSPVRQA